MMARETVFGEMQTYTFTLFGLHRLFFLELENQPLLAPPSSPTLLPHGGRREFVSYLKKRQFIVSKTPLNNTSASLENGISVSRESNKTPFSPPRREGMGMRGKRSNDNFFVNTLNFALHPQWSTP
jgi:hypothetical protein